MHQKIDIILLSGFLGSGKTTLLNELVHQSGKKHLGVLINDFGNTSLDGSVLRRSGVSQENKIYEIPGGSIFCACLKAPFLFGLNYFKSENPELLFIETSGMSDPSGFSRILDDHGMGDDFNIIHSFTLADPFKFPKLRHVLQVIPRQIQAATSVIITKADLVESAELEDLEKQIREYNTTAPIFHSHFGVLDGDPFSAGEEGRIKPVDQPESCNTPASRPSCMTVAAGGPWKKKQLDTFLQGVEGKIYRLKGYILLTEGLYFVSDYGIGFNIDCIPAGEEPEGIPPGLVLISSPEIKNELESLNRSCFV